MIFVSGSEFVSDRLWLQAAIAQMDKERISIFAGIRGKQFRFGSDCTGADAAFQAGSQWVEFQGGEPENDFASEAPDASGPMLFQLLNHQPKKLFRDMLARGFSGPCGPGLSPGRLQSGWSFAILDAVKNALLRVTEFQFQQAFTCIH